MGTMRTSEKIRLDKQHGNRVRKTRRKTEGKNTPQFTLSNTPKSTKLKVKNVTWWHTGFKKNQFYPWQTGYWNELMPTRNRHIPMDDKRKDPTDPKRTLKRIRPQQQQTYKVPTDDVENTNDTNLEGDIRFPSKPRTLLREKENMLQEELL